MNATAMSEDLQLSKEMITSSLSHVDKTLDGKGYAFVKLDVSVRPPHPLEPTQ